MTCISCEEEKTDILDYGTVNVLLSLRFFVLHRLLLGFTTAASFHV